MPDNLAVRARDSPAATWQNRAGHRCTGGPPFTWKSELPAASGIGGGSADAAACLRGLVRFWELARRSCSIGQAELETGQLGADVPMCLVSRPLVARGIGEDLTMVDFDALPCPS